MGGGHRACDVAQRAGHRQPVPARVVGRGHLRAVRGRGRGHEPPGVIGQGRDSTQGVGDRRHGPVGVDGVGHDRAVRCGGRCQVAPGVVDERGPLPRGVRDDERAVERVVGGCRHPAQRIRRRRPVADRVVGERRDPPQRVGGRLDLVARGVGELGGRRQGRAGGLGLREHPPVGEPFDRHGTGRVGDGGLPRAVDERRDPPQGVCLRHHPGARVVGVARDPTIGVGQGQHPVRGVVGVGLRRPVGQPHTRQVTGRGVRVLHRPGRLVGHGDNPTLCPLQGQELPRRIRDPVQLDAGVGEGRDVAVQV